MAVRRLAEIQPESFAFTADNVAWAEKEIAKYPEGRQASAVIALLWRAQEQEGWVSEPAIRAVAEMLDMPRIRVLEIATFYTMFQLEPVGSIAHIQVCGTTPCWLRGADDLKAVCRSRISAAQHRLSDDGAFSWEEVECLGACVNAPMIQIGADTYEDLTSETFGKLIDDLAAGRAVQPGPQVDRQFSAPVGGPTSLTEDPTVPVEAPEPEPQGAEAPEPEPKSAALPPEPESATSATEDTGPGGVEKPADEAATAEGRSGEAQGSLFSSETSSSTPDRDRTTAGDAAAAGTDDVVSPAGALNDAADARAHTSRPPGERARDSGVPQQGRHGR